jgi:hypothetical protein
VQLKQSVNLMHGSLKLLLSNVSEIPESGFFKLFSDSVLSAFSIFYI